MNGVSHYKNCVQMFAPADPRGDGFLPPLFVDAARRRHRAQIAAYLGELKDAALRKEVVQACAEELGEDGIGDVVAQFGGVARAAPTTTRGQQLEADALLAYQLAQAQEQ